MQHRVSESAESEVAVDGGACTVIVAEGGVSAIVNVVLTTVVK